MNQKAPSNCNKQFREPSDSSEARGWGGGGGGVGAHTYLLDLKDLKMVVMQKKGLLKRDQEFK